jgi:hypothetical protein
MNGGRVSAETERQRRAGAHTGSTARATHHIINHTRRLSVIHRRLQRKIETTNEQAIMPLF